MIDGTVGFDSSEANDGFSEQTDPAAFLAADGPAPAESGRSDDPDGVLNALFNDDLSPAAADDIDAAAVDGSGLLFMDSFNSCRIRVFPEDG